MSGATKNAAEGEGEEAKPLLHQGAGGGVTTQGGGAVDDEDEKGSYWAHVPWSQVLICSACKFVDSAFDFGLYMYLPYLTLWLTSSEDAASAGWYSGLVASGRHFGHLLGAPVWGFLSDRWGSKLLLLSALAGVAATHVGFAFSTSIW
jgi:predicted MFS family arabinose efflux permease